tara:strand:+ start:472 stop:879 length:408 start_codon:yes stop_codon:yes gene_type:complete
MQKNDWVITSSHPVADILAVKLLDKTLPGFLGTFFYPEDAVFHLNSKKSTTISDFQNVVMREQDRLAELHKGLLMTRMNHLTFHDQIVDPIEEDEVEDEGEEDIEDNSEFEEDDKQDVCWYEDDVDEEEDKTASK